jgi:DNA modification methylase/ParB-like chromosome segregation protein Spo0J
MNDKRIVEVAITDIKITKSFRKDLGDIEALAQNIEEVGLLHPIGVTPDNRLIFGKRRLRAYQVLGRKKIPARVIRLDNILLGKFSEDFFRKDYTVTERVAIVEALRSFKHGGDRRSKQVRKCDDETLTIDQAAKRAGLGGKDGYFRAKSVVENAVPELVEAMDEGRMAISKAAEIARLPKQDQRRSAKLGRKVIDRDPHDFYPTPPEVTRALLKVEEFDGEIWEPACGDGAMATVLQEAGYDVLSSDLIDRGCGDVRDFLTSRNVSDNIVTNPPFKLAEKFLKKALACSRKKVAMFLPLNFLEGQDRNELLRRSPLKTVYVFTNRVTFYRTGTERKGHGRASFAWYVWEHGYQGRPQIDWVSSDGNMAVVKRQKRLSHVKAVLPMKKAKPITVNSVVEGDCQDLIPGLPNASISLAVTSPPYAEQRKQQYPGVPEREYPEFTVDWMARLWEKLAYNGSVLIVIRPNLKNGVIKDYVLRTRLLLREFGWKECEKLIWHKPDGGACMGSMKRPRRVYEEILWFSKANAPYVNVKACGHWSEKVSYRGTTRFGFGGGAPMHTGQNSHKRAGQTRITDVIEAHVGAIPKGIDHPAMFPVELAEKLIPTFCPPGGTILDPFAGSGSTLIAAKKLGLDYYGFDIMPEYCKIARKRLAATIRGTGISKAG